MTDFWRKIVVRSGYLAASLVILAALLVSLTNLLTPVLNAHRGDFEKLASRLLGRPVQIESIDVAWDYYEPELTFHNVMVIDPNTHQPNLSIPRIRIDLAIIKSLLNRTFILDSLKITGVHLALHEQKPGQISVNGFGQFVVNDNLTGHALNPNAVLAWIFSQPRLVLQHFEIQYFPYNGAEKDVRLKWLALTNTSRNHQLTGRALLNQDSPTQASIRFNWQGDITDLPHVTADLFVSLDNIFLAQWFKGQIWHGLQVKKGRGNATIQATWNQNAWQTLQTNFELYDIGMLPDQVFDNALAFDHVTGSLNAKKDGTGAWLLTAKNLQATNEDLDAHADMSMTFPPNDSPVINLMGNFTLNNAKKVSNYLPLKIFDSELNTWLRAAFRGGQVTAGHAVLQGHVSDFPFDKGSGKFEIDGTVKNIDLRYAPDWPMMKNINGKIVFLNRSMKVDIASAQTGDVPLQTIHAEIPDLGNNPVLTANSTVQTDLSRGLQFIQNSPLRHTVGKNLQALKLTGPMQLALTLAVPLNHPDDVKVTGDTTISNAVLNLPDWNLSIDQLSGAFHFTEDSLTASNMMGELFKRPISLSFLTEHPAGKSGFVTATLQSAISTTDIKSWLDLPVEDLMQGTTNFKTELILTPPHDSSRPTQIMIHSDLKGIAVNLPGAYGKKAEDTTDFRLTFLIRDNQPLKAEIDYNTLFSVKMVLQRVKQKLGLFSADLHLGKGDANWQTQSGVVITGNIDQINWDKISPYLSQFTNKPASMQTKKSWMSPDMFRAVDLQTKTVNISGLQLNNLRIQLTKNAGNFILGLTNADMAGQITIPQAGIKQGVQARFSRLNLSSKWLLGKQTPLNPRDLPPILFNGDDVRFNDMALGSATLNLVPGKNGLLVKQLDLISSAYTLHATGLWTNVRSQLQGILTTSNVTDLLKSWGFSSNNLIGSTANLDFDLNWPGSFFRPSMAGLSGTLSLKTGQGRIINLSNDTNAKIGLGSLLNIFSLQSLPSLGSLFQKGYFFNSLTGDFTLRNGNAITQNTSFIGPVATIDIAGRIGLAAKDLDIKLGVTPHVTGSLPVVAIIATANPIVGVATWAVDKMVSPAVSHMATYNYSITGSWANPVWNQISASKASATTSGAGAAVPAVNR